MNEKALNIVSDYVKIKHGLIEFQIFIVWKCKILQNCKYLISTDIGDGMYYEVTYNGDKEEWYLDCYEKIDKKIIKG